jgi:hypothetical protein
MTFVAYGMNFVPHGTMATRAKSHFISGEFEVAGTNFQFIATKMEVRGR